MPYFDRHDICAAHHAIEVHYNVGGWLRERPSNRRRHESTDVQLRRMGYRPAPTRLDCFDALSRNGKAIYRALERRYGFHQPRFAVRITYPEGLGPTSYLSHKDRSAWSRRRAQQHAADVRNNRTGIRGFTRVDVVEHGQ